MKLAQRVQSLKPSPTLALAAKAKELAAQGHKVIALSVGEPDWDTFEVAKAAGIKAIQEGFSKYTPSNGIPELRQAIAKQTEKEIGLKVSPEDVTVSTGGKFVIFSALQTLLNPGDEVIIPAPYWVSYPTMVELAQGTPVCVACDESVGFKLTPELLKKSITPKTRLIILNSPSNPTGVMYSKEELKGLAQVLKEAPNVMIMSDDIYNRLVFEGEVAPHLLHVAPELLDRVMMVNGAAKTFSMTGWRVGWAIGPSVWIKAMTNYQSQSVSCAAGFAQKATLQAILEGEGELKKALTQLKQRRDFVVGLFKDVKGVTLSSPDGAFYIWPNIKSFFGKSYNGKKILSSGDFSNALLEDQKVVCVPGQEFGLDGYLRISYVIKDTAMTEAVERLKAFIAKLT
ncbi:MAG: pyridoxal phosphate-dependent aminotransferase [Bdellovibrionota bacterium]